MTKIKTLILFAKYPDVDFFKIPISFGMSNCSDNVDKDWKVSHLGKTSTKEATLNSRLTFCDYQTIDRQMNKTSPCVWNTMHALDASLMKIILGATCTCNINIAQIEEATETLHLYL